MIPPATSLALPDGRTLELTVTGSGADPVLAFHHGTPGCGRPFGGLRDAAVARGWRLVTWSRPGYAGSTRLAGRSVADVAADYVAVLDHLGADRAHVAGWSGGGPHALACAALAPDRVAGTLVVAGVAPYPAEGRTGDLDWLDGMGGDNLAEFGAALSGEGALRAFLEQAAQGLRGLTGAQVTAALATLASERDVAALAEDPAFADDLATSFDVGTGAGVDGWLDDDLAFVTDWGFDLAGLPDGVHLWQGSADRMVPFAHGRWLAEHVLRARARLEPDEGHISLMTARLGEMLDVLADG